MTTDNACTMSCDSSNAIASIDQIRESFRRADWEINYEVNPEWAKFCSFGPEDIGSVWEKIGAIRKRPRFDTVIIPPFVLDGIRNAVPSFRDDVTDARDYALFGLRIAASSYIPLNRALLMSAKSV